MAMVSVSYRVTRWSLQESSATRSARVSSRCPTGERFSRMPLRCSSQSSSFSKPGTTGLGEVMAWVVEFHLTTALPCAVLGPPASLPAIIGSFLLPSVLHGSFVGNAHVFFRRRFASSTSEGKQSSARTSTHSPLKGSCRAIQFGYSLHLTTKPRLPASSSLRCLREANSSRLGSGEDFMDNFFARSK